MTDGEGTEEARGVATSGSPGRLTLAAVFVLYSVSILIATYPAVLHCRTNLPVLSLYDPVQHLTIFRWYERCLVEGRSPLVHPDIQYPVGAPLGLFTPLQLQSALFLGLGVFTNNDILRYNILVFAELLFTGLGTFALAWTMTRHRWGATLAGLSTMLSGGMLINLMGGGTELLALGGFPLFLIGWIRFLDAPTRGRLFAAVGLYALLAACAPYYGVIGTIPAILYVLWATVKQPRGDRLVWIRSRIPWLFGFGAIGVLILPALFPAHVWAIRRGVSLARPFEDFERFGTTIWHYAIPWVSHPLNDVVPPFWTTPGIVEKGTVYLGVVALALLNYAALRGTRTRGASFLWITFASLVVLSLGAYATAFGRRIPLPALWLWESCPPFRSLRVPVRFAYFATICASVLVAGALAHWFGTIQTPRRRHMLGTILAVLTVADLSMTPFPIKPLPEPPRCYQYLKERHPGATLCEVHPGDPAVEYQAMLAYWRDLHGGKTSAGYSGCANHRYEVFAQATSPFEGLRLMEPGYLSGSDFEAFDLVTMTRFEDYAWLYLTAHKFDFLVLHRWTWDRSPLPAVIDRVRDRLRAGIVYEDARSVVIDRRKLPAPDRPVVLCTTGWRTRLPRMGGRAAATARDARVLVFNPDPDVPLKLAVEMAANRSPRTVRLLADGHVTSTFVVPPGAARLHVSPSLTRPRGVSELVLQSDAEEPAPDPIRKALPGGAPDFSLWVHHLAVVPDPDSTRIASSEPAGSPDAARR